MSGAQLMMQGRQPAAGGPFSPLDIAWHTAFWAEDPAWTNPGDGVAVAQWNDASGNARHATQATGLNQPVYRASEATFNNRPVVQGDASDFMKTAAFTALTQPNTLVVIGSTSATSGNRFFCDGITSTDRHLFFRSSGGSFNANAGASLANGTANTSAHLFVAEFNGASTNFDRDGTRVTGNAGTHSVTGLTLFADNAGSNQLTGFLAFVGLHNGTLTAGELADLEAWAASHYGLTIS